MKSKNLIQTDLFELLFPRKAYADIAREEKEAFEAKLAKLSFDEKVIARTHSYLVKRAGSMADEDENPVDTYAEIIETAATRKDLFKGGDYEIWYYEMPDEKWDAETKEYVAYLGYQLAFRIGNQVIAVDYLVKNVYESEISFPAMCMKYMDAAGNPIPFTIRDAFIEKGLGLLEHGEYRLGKRGKNETLSFSSLKTTLPKIMDYLQAQIYGDGFDGIGYEKDSGCEM
jgi:hypothetical protein